MAYFPVPEGRGGILTLLHGRADILQVLPPIAVVIIALAEENNPGQDTGNYQPCRADNLSYPALQG